MFQFHKGSIRTITPIGRLITLTRFNSIKVQLEPLMAADIASDYLFQFHKGSIRTMVPNQKRRDQDCFNSIKVQLEPAKLII